ncbi:MAG: hypothetical protein CMP23_16140 [Rickettsiales bacterium]|nr:hypothetical protein [Rickettsiales bacterium]|tara:strand:- start:809 stop:2062 length:1254 start_codon:yes stop_codon:yes gene_type:complete
MHRISLVSSCFFILLIGGCTAQTPTEDTEPEQSSLPPLPDFVADCSEDLNDSLEDAAGLIGENRQRYEGLQLCAGDEDYYRIDVPPGKWLSVEVFIDGSGNNNPLDSTDLDLWEVDDNDDELWWSATENNRERLAWFNPTEETEAHYLVVKGYNGAEADYDIEIRRSTFHGSERDCDDAYDDEDPDDESGPCNRIMQFPQAHSEEDGYLVSHWAAYSNLRREVTYLVRYAAAATRAEYPDTLPLGLLDMSEDDGDTPGRMENQLRHPEGTHVQGNDIDIAYYQTGEDNLGRSVCPEDGYFCTAEPDILDAERTVFFMSKLAESQKLRVVGVDPMIADVLKETANEMHDEGKIDEAARSYFFTGQMAYGDGWPFHQHHMHFSWQWESGYEGREAHHSGCMSGPDVAPDYRQPRTQARR